MGPVHTSHTASLKWRHQSKNVELGAVWLVVADIFFCVRFCSNAGLYNYCSGPYTEEDETVYQYIEAAAKYRAISDPAHENEKTLDKGVCTSDVVVAVVAVVAVAAVSVVLLSFLLFLCENSLHELLINVNCCCCVSFLLFLCVNTVCMSS